MSGSTFYAQIDCDLPRDPKMLRAGPLPRLLYIQCVLYGRENLTDGRIEEVLLPLIAIDIPKPQALMGKLVAVGLVETTDYGWRIPPHVWGKRNPTRAAVDEKREADRVRKMSGRNPGGRASDSGRRPGETETKDETQDETKQQQQHVELLPAAAAALDLYVAHRLHTEDGIKSPRVYARTIRDDETEQNAELLNELAALDLAPRKIAVRVFGLTEMQIARIPKAAS